MPWITPFPPRVSRTRNCRISFSRPYNRLDCYPEVPETLRTLKDLGYGTVILSNGSPEMLSSGVRNSLLEDLLDAVLSVEDVGVFKPDP